MSEKSHTAANSTITLPPLSPTHCKLTWWSKMARSPTCLTRQCDCTYAQAHKLLKHKMTHTSQKAHKYDHSFTCMWGLLGLIFSTESLPCLSISVSGWTFWNLKHRVKTSHILLTGWFFLNIVQNIASLSKKCDVFTRCFRFQKAHPETESTTNSLLIIIKPRRSHS